MCKGFYCLRLNNKNIQCTEKKNQLDATEWFIVLCPSSGTRDYMCVITAYGA